MTEKAEAAVEAVENQAASEAAAATAAAVKAENDRKDTEANTTKVAAEATVALAAGTAAAAIQDATERERNIKNEVDGWRTKQTAEMEELKRGQATLMEAVSGMGSLLSSMAQSLTPSKSVVQKTETETIVKPEDKKPESEEEDGQKEVKTPKRGRRFI